MLGDAWEMLALVESGHAQWLQTTKMPLSLRHLTIGLRRWPVDRRVLDGCAGALPA